MHGNVSEWCEDIFFEFLIDPKSPDRVIRGGSFLFNGEGLRSATRIYHPGSNSNLMLGVGFRVVVDIK
jgi:formylglycine-generating enzyme required for sulfatase activity